jgi:raffinose/stachyose/melibiose transport system permease protein
VLAAVLEEFVHQKLRGILRTIYFIPAVISITVAGILFSFLYNPQIGLVNEFLGAIGLDSWQHSWLGEPDTAMWSIIAMSQWQSIGYTAVLFVVAIQRVPREFYEAARVDGAGRVRSFFSITIPMVREMTTLISILTISGAFLVFNEVMVMTAGGPSNSSQVLGTWLYRNAFFQDDMGYASAIASVIFVVTFTIGAAQVVISRRRRIEW